MDVKQLTLYIGITGLIFFSYVIYKTEIWEDIIKSIKKIFKD